MNTDATEAVDPSFLAETPLFQLLDEAEREDLASLMQKQYFPADKVLFNFGEPGDRAYLVCSGKVEIFGSAPTGEKIVYTVAEPGDLFGEISLLDKGPRTASAKSLEESIFLVLEREALTRFLRIRPDAGIDLLAVLASRLRQTDELARSRLPRNSNTEIEQKLSPILRAANTIANFSGSMTFLFLNLVFFTVWVVWNTEVIEGLVPFDPYPFGFLTMAVSLEAIVLSIIVLLSQNLHSERDRIRANVEYDINLQAELEVAELHNKVDSLQAEVLARLERIEQRTR